MDTATLHAPDSAKSLPPPIAAALNAPQAKPRRGKKAKPVVERKPRLAPLSMGLRFRVMAVINEAPLDEPDVALAARINAGVVDLPRPVSAQTVAAYRVELGLASVRQPSRAALRAQVERLERELADAKQGRLRLEHGSEGPEALFVNGQLLSGATACAAVLSPGAWDDHGATITP